MVVENRGRDRWREVVFRCLVFWKGKLKVIEGSLIDGVYSSESMNRILFCLIRLC